MPTGRRPTLVILLACCTWPVLGSGCAGSGPMLSRRTTVGTLRSSVSQLEFEKSELQGKLAALQAENRRLEDRLAQEEAATGELSARLDDARVLLRERGYDDRDLAGTNPAEPSSPGPSRTTPAGRSQRPGRKPPFARIPGRSDAPAFPDPFGDLDEDEPLGHPPVRQRDPYGPQSRNDDPSPWLPVARGSNSLYGGFR